MLQVRAEVRCGLMYLSLSVLADGWLILYALITQCTTGVQPHPAPPRPRHSDPPQVRLLDRPSATNSTPVFWQTVLTLEFTWADGDPKSQFQTCMYVQHVRMYVWMYSMCMCVCVIEWKPKARSWGWGRWEAPLLYEIWEGLEHRPWTGLLFLLTVDHGFTDKLCHHSQIYIAGYVVNS